LFPGGRTRASSRILNFSNFWKNQKADRLLIMIFENSLPKGYFWSNKMKYEISLLSWDSRYFWSGALNKFWFYFHFLFYFLFLFLNQK